MNRKTSRMEQAIFFYVKRIFPDAMNRYKVGGKIEADIYIPSLKVAIEYDGLYWHKKAAERDKKKNQSLNDLGIYVIRVRDDELPDLPQFYGKTFILWTKQRHGDIPGSFPSDCIAKVINELSRHTEDTDLREKLASFELSFEEYKKDYPSFLSKVYDKPIDNNITTSCGYEYWDQEKNIPLCPENVPLNSSEYAWIKCRNGNSKNVHIRDFFGQRHCSHDCAFCEKFICPYIEECEEDCEFCNKAIHDYIHGIKVFPESSISLIALWNWGHSRQKLEALKALLDGEYTEEQQKRLQTICRLDRINGSFINLYFPTYEEDLHTLIRFREKYPNVRLLFNASGLDDSIERREKLISYYQWEILNNNISALDIAAQSKMMESMSQNLFEMIIDLCSKDEIAYKCHHGVLRHSVQYIITSIMHFHPELILTEEKEMQLKKADEEYKKR